MNKKILSIIIAAAVIIAAGGLIFWYLNSPKTQIDTSGIILFYSEGCPHCQNVDNFIAQNNVEQKVKFARLEVFNNKDNQKVLLQKAQACNLPLDQIGVPLLWDGNTCIVGDQDIIKFFQGKI